jgi:hypothetical protein
VDGKPADVDTTAMEDFLSKLSALNADSFNAATTAAGLPAPALVAAASYDRDKFERVRLSLGKGQAFGVREGEPGVAVIDADTVSETIKALDAVVTPAPAPAS